jgi:hypothetical protein
VYPAGGAAWTLLAAPGWHRMRTPGHGARRRRLAHDAEEISMLRRLAASSVFVLAPCAARAQAPPVPAAYQDLHRDLAATLEVFASTLPPAATASPVVFSTDLSPADANRLEQLIAPTTLAGALLAVDRLAEMGVEAVTVNISYPMLYRPFHRGRDEYRRYLGFYKAVAYAARLRGLKLIVKSGVLLRTDPRVEAFYRQVPALDEYRAGRLQVAATIVREIGPDYLTLQAEPDVEASQTGQPVGTAAEAYALVRFLVTGLRALGARGALLGAGAGSWHAELLDLAAALATLDGLDYLDLHVYPVNRDFLWRVLEVADVARQAGKDVAVSEAWLYKIRDAELPVNGPLVKEVLSRDVFSFWQPLDARFADVLVRTAVAKGFAFLSLFWAKYLFSYLDHAAAWHLEPDALLELSQVTATQAMLAGRLTGTGHTYRALILWHSRFEARWPRPLERYR